MKTWPRPSPWRHRSRHPLPTPETAAATFGRLGIGPGTQVVAYDDMGGALAAARLWWMLRWLGHDAVAVLDGGIQRWQRGGDCLRAGGVESAPVQAFIPQVRPELLVTAAQVDAMRQDSALPLLDARSADRYRGENENDRPRGGPYRRGHLCPLRQQPDRMGVFCAHWLRCRRIIKTCWGKPPSKTWPSTAALA